MKRQMLKPAEAACILGVGTKTITSLLRQGAIRGEKIRNSWRVFKTDFYKQFRIPRTYRPTDGALFYTTLDAGEILALSCDTIRRMCGVEFPAYKVGQTWVIPIKQFKRKFRLR